MDNSSSVSRRKGIRETLRFFWCRTSSVVRSLFSRKRVTWAPAETMSTQVKDEMRTSIVEAKLNLEVSDALSSSGDYIREWEKVAEISNEGKSCKFRVASYNILCQQTLEAMPELYNHLDSTSPFFSWSHRWSIIANEIKSLDADILGLQEIPETILKEFIQPLLENLGYAILFHEKTNEEIIHGLVIAVQKEMFEIESHENINFFQLEDSVLDRGNIAQIARVTCRLTGSTLLLSNTHVVFNPFRGDTKFAQLATLFSRIHQFRRNAEPVICLGDFNIEQGSQLYEYITTGRLDTRFLSLRHGSGQLTLDASLADPDEFLFDLPRTTFVHTMMDRSGMIKSRVSDVLYSLDTNLSHIFTHQLKFASVYPPSETLKISTNHADFGNPDFIFFDAGNSSSSSLRLIRRLSLPFSLDLRDAKRWPNEKIPSDHICLLAEFEFIGV